ncbi:MAG: DUF1934 domain-containing protein [Clostridiales bacterium]|nr:DUF1934 domain-containing protein [Clostridiales bacterium]
MEPTYKEQEVLVSVKGVSIHEENSQEEISLLTVGRLCFISEEEIILQYDEVDLETQKTSHTKILINAKQVTMTKTGDYGSNMLFEKGKNMQSRYRTPFGDLEMNIYTTKTEIDLLKDRGEIFLQYQLTIQNSFSAMHEIEIFYIINNEEEKND